jgi:hypothetical protein
LGSEDEGTPEEPDVVTVPSALTVMVDEPCVEEELEEKEFPEDETVPT